MTERRPCPDCHARPIPTAKAKRCLSCAKASGLTSWRQLLTRVRDREGDAAARALAKEQGVPYSCAASPGGGAPVSVPSPAPSNDEDDLELPDTIESHEIGSLARQVEYLALRRTLEAVKAGRITDGQLIQVAHMADKIAERYGGGTTAAHIELIFEDAS